MKTDEIKKALKGKLNWNYYYYNVVNESGEIVQAFDELENAQNYKKEHNESNLYIQYCHHISKII